MKEPKISAGLILAVASGRSAPATAWRRATLDRWQRCRERFHNEPWRVSWATTTVILWGGAISSCLYCAFKLTKNGTWKNCVGAGAGRTLGLALAMSLLHNGAIYLFNLGFPSWAIWVCRWVTRPSCRLPSLWQPARFPHRGMERRQPPKQTPVVAGIATLVAGVCVLAGGNAMGQK